MDFKDQIKQLGEKVIKFKDQILTEEATKSAFILPLIQILGYDVFNPTEVVPEFITDYGAKNIEKVDFAILKDNQPVFIIECKIHEEKLHIDTLSNSKHYTQLHKYFHLTKSRFALLTNGIVYHFFTDLDAPNKMDVKPFFSFDITNIKEHNIKELSKFHKNGFDINSILTTASELKYSNSINDTFKEQLKNPSQEFIKFFVSKVYDGRVTEKIMALFTEIVKKTFDQTFNDMVSDRLMSAINMTKEPVIEQVVEAPIIEVDENKTITTEEEINSYYIVKSILRTKIPSNRITYRDSQNYFSIFLDDNNRKPICRIYLNGVNKKYLGVFDKDKKESKHEITSIDDIYNFSSDLFATIANYEG